MLDLIVPSDKHAYDDSTDCNRKLFRENGLPQDVTSEYGHGWSISLIENATGLATFQAQQDYIFCDDDVHHGAPVDFQNDETNFHRFCPTFHRTVSYNSFERQFISTFVVAL